MQQRMGGNEHDRDVPPKEARMNGWIDGWIDGWTEGI